MHSRARLLPLDLPLIRPSPMSSIALLGLPGQLALRYVIRHRLPSHWPPPCTLPAPGHGPDRPAKPVGATASTGDPPGAVSRPEAGGRARPRGFCSRPRGASLRTAGAWCCRICPPVCRVWRADACMPARLHFWGRDLARPGRAVCILILGRGCGVLRPARDGRSRDGADGL